MTDNCRIVFEVENLRNASPATVSRAGIIYVSASDLGWKPLVESWLLRRLELGSNRHGEVEVLEALFEKWLKQAPPNSGAAADLFDWHVRNLRAIMPTNDSIMIANALNILAASLRTSVEENSVLSEGAYRRVACWACMWGFGGLLEPEERKKLWAKFSEVLEANHHEDEPG
ncbi:unnamed protein product [Prorocentrum cordatum]|uniref:Dynein heavy chain AAA 5 extension domain-containing protein n=1 Tax=Prorocentrum cordatum TaxID=2364126 RepID=A0ABN9RVE6_9DINO|nr:unnamed protein product [Polarella glacialis]